MISYNWGEEYECWIRYGTVERGMIISLCFCPEYELDCGWVKMLILDLVKWWWSSTAAGLMRSKSFESTQKLTDNMLIKPTSFNGTKKGQVRNKSWPEKFAIWLQRDEISGAKVINSIITNTGLTFIF